MSDTEWLPIQAVEGLVWRRGAYYVNKYEEAHKMDENCSFPTLYGGIQEYGKYKPDLSPEAEYYVDDPLKIFAALAHAGKSYGLGVYKPKYLHDGILVAKKGRSDNRLLRFIRDYGLPINGRQMSMGYIDDNGLCNIGNSDIGRGIVGEDLRSTAAIAHLCWELWEGLQELEEGDKRAKSKAIEKLKSYLHEIDVSTLDPSFYESSLLPDISNGNRWSFFPSLTSKQATCHWATFASSDATDEEILIRHGVYTTISKVAQWYLSSINIVLSPLNGEASPPQLMVRTRGFLSYLWIHFLHAVVGKGVPKFYLVQCRQEQGANGCGRWFYSDSPNARRCHDCNALINRIETRIKRDHSLKGQKDKLIEEERRKILQSR